MTIDHWNHRVVRRQLTEWSEGEDVQYGFSIHEVYYDDAGKPNAITEDAIQPYGDTPEELLEELIRFLYATTKPTLEYEDIAGKGEER